jgi:protein TonB
MNQSTIPHKAVWISLLLLLCCVLPVLAHQEASPQSVPPLARVTLSGNVQAAFAGPIKKVAPVYPAEAKAARVEGTVVLDVVIGIDGSVQSVRAKSGPELLVPAAIEAAKQWEYAPSTFNGKAVEVEYDVTMGFRFGQ